MLQLLSSWIGLVSVTLYLFVNVRASGPGLGGYLLIVAMASTAFVFMTRRQAVRETVLGRSGIWLLAFLTYFLLKLLIDVSEFSEIKAMTVGTSGGLIFALLLGVLVSFTLGVAADSRQQAAIPIGLGACFIVLCLGLSVAVCQSHLALVRSDIFLVELSERNYQRSADFIAMIVLIVSTQIALLYRLTSKTAIDAFIVFFCVAAYLSIVLLLSFTSQLIGSNKGLVVSFALAIGTLAWMYGPKRHRFRWRGILRPELRNAIGSFREAFAGYSVRVCLFVAVLVVSVAAIFHFSGLDFQRFRVFGFEDQRVGGNSLVSRLRLLSDNFLTQFAVNPLFGNLRAHDLTTGEGSYAHSLISLLSHLGLVGTALFAGYQVSLYQGMNRVNSYKGEWFTNIDLGVLRIILMGILLSFALIATYFTWMPLWFAFGLLFPPLTLRNRRSGYFRSRR